MLPRFRPAMLGPETLPRPSIRPVRPGPPPPPPSPPSPARKNASGIGRTRLGLGPVEGLAVVPMSDALDELEAPTANGQHVEPETLCGEPETLCGEPETLCGEPETLSGGGPDTLPADTTPRNPRRRVNVISDISEIASYEDETQARAVDEDVLDQLRAPPAADLDVPYESLPSLEVRSAYDSYEREFSERDPAPVVRGRDGGRASARIRRAAPAAYADMPTPWAEAAAAAAAAKAAAKAASSEVDAPLSEREPSPDSFLEPSYPAAANANDLEFFPGRREESGPRERPLPPSTRSYAAPPPAYDDSSDSAQWGLEKEQPASQVTGVAEPQPAALEEKAFVVGVQPLRGATPDAWGTPQADDGRLANAARAPNPPASASRRRLSGYGPQPSQLAQHTSEPPQYPAAVAYPQAAYAQASRAQSPYAQPYAQGPYAQGSYAPQPSPYAQPPAYAFAPPAPGAAYAQPYAPAPSYPPPGHPMGAYAYPQAAHAHQAMAYAGHAGALASQQIAAAPLRSQLAPAPNSKAGRFAWFLAGAAFGVTFAFFATGFFGGSSASSEFPPAAPLPTLTTPAAPAAPPPAAAPPVAAPPVASAQAPAPPPAAANGAAPAGPAAATTAATTNVNALPRAGTTAAAPPRPAPPPPPPRPRVQPTTRRAAPATPPASTGPRNLGGGGPGADDTPSAPTPPTSGGAPDLGDLLGAGLKP